MISFLDIMHFLFKTERFGEFTLSQFSGEKPTQSGSIDRVSPYLQSPKPTQNKIHKPNT
jgi:hypothetical protein